jgi:hypothetical protein
MKHYYLYFYKESFSVDRYIDLPLMHLRGGRTWKLYNVVVPVNGVINSIKSFLLDTLQQCVAVDNKNPIQEENLQK